MVIIGVDYHPSFQQVAFLDQETGAVVLDVAERLGICAVGRIRFERGTARNRT
jgi:hypothetical protein